MKHYTITGSLGHISRPIVQKLIAAGHTVTVISSSPNKKNEIEHLGARAAIGSLTDRPFLEKAFAGADAVYLMIPPNLAAADPRAFQKEVADNYLNALEKSKVTHVVLLSSLGAHLGQGAGPIDGLAYLEQKLKTLPGMNAKLLRPGYFYYNFLSMSALISQAGIMGSNFGSTTEKMALVHPDDIAEVAARHLLDPVFSGHTVENVVSDLRLTSEVAQVLGQAINKPGLPWVTFKDEEALQGLLQAGLNPGWAGLFVEMGKAFREGRVQEDFYKSGAAPVGKIKLEDFAREFAAQFNASVVNA
jgi:uncharacterized protein YbjT (DUF2867 family)